MLFLRSTYSILSFVIDVLRTACRSKERYPTSILRGLVVTYNVRTGIIKPTFPCFVRFVIPCVCLYRKVTSMGLRFVVLYSAYTSRGRLPFAVGTYTFPYGMYLLQNCNKLKSHAMYSLRIPCLQLRVRGVKVYMCIRLCIYKHFFP